MTEPNLELAEELARFVHNAAIAQRLKSEVDEIEIKLQEFKQLLDPTEEQCAEYNNLHIKQLELDIEYHEYAKKADEFQLKELQQD